MRTDFRVVDTVCPYPSLFYVYLFDSRLDFEESRLCDLTTSTAVGLADGNTFLLTASLTTDTLGLIEAPTTRAADHTCASFYRTAFALDPPYTSYAQSVQDNYIEVQGDIPHMLTTIYSVVISFRFASLSASTMESVPGIDQLDIWLNAGAIVGAVQFLACFLGIFNT